MSGACMRLSWFISSSYSKSEIARRPLTIAGAPTRARELDDEDVERLGPDVAAGRAVASSMKPSRSSVPNSGWLLRTERLTTATTTSSNSSAAR